MSLQQQPAADEQSSMKQPQRKTRFTIDAILDTSSSADDAKDVEQSAVAPGAFIAPDDDQLASATDPGPALPLPVTGATEESQEPDEQCTQTTFYHIDEDLERSGEGSTSEPDQRRAECSSLLARTAAAFHRRHQHRVAQLRSFSELFLAQYEQYERQLRNHFHHRHSALRPAPPPPPARSGSLLAPDAARTASSALPWSPVDRAASQLPTSSSVRLQPRASRHDTCVEQSAYLVDGSTAGHHAPASTASARSYDDSETHQRAVVDYSSDSKRAKWTASDIMGIIQILQLCLTSHTFRKRSTQTLWL